MNLTWGQKWGIGIVCIAIGLAIAVAIGYAFYLVNDLSSRVNGLTQEVIVPILKTPSEQALQELKKAIEQVTHAEDELKQATADPAKTDNVAVELKKAKLREAQMAEKSARELLQRLFGLFSNRDLWGDRWPILLPYIIFGIYACIFLLLLTIGIFRPDFLASLSNISTARGLITFLITLATVAIATMIVVASIVSRGENKENLSVAKDLLAVLLGVLGTIVGYYFGQSSSSSTISGSSSSGRTISSSTPSSGSSSGVSNTSNASNVPSSSSKSSLSSGSGTSSTPA